MTTSFVGELDPATTDVAARPAQPEGADRRAPAWMWIAGLALITPLLVPIGSLVLRVVGAGSTIGETLFAGRTLDLLVRSAVFTLLVTVASAMVGVVAAWVLVRTDIGSRRLWTVIVAMPLVIPSYVIALSLLSVSGARGLVAALAGFELPRISGSFGAWLALTLSTYPYVFLVVRAALTNVDPALEEAARSLGAGPWKAFRTVLLPQMRPAIAAGSLLAALYTLSDFGAVSLMGFDAFTRVIYAQYQGRLDRTPAAVLAVVLILIALAVLWGEQRTRGRAAYHGRRPKRVAPTVELTGRGRAAAYGFLGSLCGVGLALPIFVLVAWLWRGLSGGQTIDMPWGSLAGSVSGSLLAAIVATAGALPVAVLSVRYPSRSSRWLRRGVFVMFSLPHITVALAVVFFASNFLGGLYQSLTLLVLVYAALFLAQSTSAAEATLLQVDPNLEDASRGLGHGSFATLRRITVPLIGRGLAAGGVLVFLTTMKELPATLLLRPTGFDTLAIRIWSTTNELFFARAAAPALVLVVVAAVPMYLLLLRPQSRA